MRFQSTILFCTMLTIATYTSMAQDLLQVLDEETAPENVVTTATFKSTRIINGHSIERMQAGQLDFRIHHRFGNINTGPYEFFGLDEANIKFSLEYGITDWVMIGLGRDTYQKTFDGFTKFSILRQSKGIKNIPVSLSLFSNIAVNTLTWSDPKRDNFFSSRLSYVYQLLIARKFSERLSLQLSPTLIHKNLVPTTLDPNDLFSLGGGGRFKLSKRIAFNYEYYYVFRPAYSTGKQIYHNSFSLGIDIETGGHVFNILLTNSRPITEKGFITETTGSWKEGDIRLGFNISRAFSITGKNR